MSKKGIALILLSAALPFIFGACAPKTEETPDAASPVSFGSFDETGVYTNEWLGISFSLPEDLKAASAEQLGALLGETAGIVNDGTVTEQQLNEDTSGVYLDFALFDEEGVCTLTLSYEDTVKTSGSRLTAENYLANIRSQTETNKTYTYEVREISGVVIAGLRFSMLKVAMSENMTVNYYANTKDGITVVLTLVNYTGQPIDMYGFLDSMSALK